MLYLYICSVLTWKRVRWRCCQMPGWNPASKYHSLTCPESRRSSPADHKVLSCPHSRCLMLCLANSTSFPCGLLLLPVSVSHRRGREPSLQGPILVCVNRLVHTAIEALEYHQKKICVPTVATIPVYTSGVEADIICWQVEEWSVQGYGDGGWVWCTWWREERWRESGFVSMEKGCLREALIADVLWLRVTNLLSQVHRDALF